MTSLRMCSPCNPPPLHASCFSPDDSIPPRVNLSIRNKSSSPFLENGFVGVNGTLARSGDGIALACELMQGNSGGASKPWQQLMMHTATTGTKMNAPRCMHRIYGNGAFSSSPSPSSSTSSDSSTASASSSSSSNAFFGELQRKTATTQEAAMLEHKEEVAIVWFKHDLRMDDHLGLAASAQYHRVIPLFIFDSHFYAGWSRERLLGLFDAVLDLKRCLQVAGSDLVIRRGRSKDVLLALAQEVGAADIITEEEIEHSWHELVGSVSASLSVESLTGHVTRLKHWRAPLYDLEGIEELTDNYKEFKSMRCPILPPTEPLTLLPPLVQDTDPGAVPALDVFYVSVGQKRKENPFFETFQAAQEQEAESLLLESPHKVNGQIGHVTKAATNGVSRKKLSGFVENSDKISFNFLWDNRRQRNKEPEAKCEMYDPKGGATGAEDFLQRYIRALEETESDISLGMYQHIMKLENRPGASFRAIFNRALELGTLSRRRVYYEAIKYERERNGGRLSPFGLSSFTAAAAIEDVKSIEWYEMIQKKSQDQGTENGFQVGSWRWRGYLIQYSTLGDEGPAVVLIHGFGAFWEHYRDNIRGLAEKGNRVWGLTMVGFGRSEKPPIAYTELLLAELVRDFIVEVVKEPVGLAGNSIGGYTTCVVAGLWPTLVKSLVLLNTAGQVTPDYTSLTYKKPREKSFIAKRGADVLIIYLRHLSNRLLKRCYPHKTGRVDSWLQSEVMRPSYDPGSTAVLESIFHLNQPLPLNFYLDRYNGKVLVIQVAPSKFIHMVVEGLQGIRDPLHNSTKRAAMMQTHCSNVTTRYLNAGHCPHDELPDEVNALIHDWLRCSASEPATETADLVTFSHDEVLVKDESQLMKADWFSYFSR